MVSYVVTYTASSTLTMLDRLATAESESLHSTEPLPGMTALVCALAHARAQQKVRRQMMNV